MSLCRFMNNIHEEKVREIVRVQREENREAIFFVYDDGSTTDVFKGEATHIQLNKRQQKKILNNGNLKMSVHSHPSLSDPSTIDIMTGLLTSQDGLCVATPIRNPEVDDEYMLTCLDFSSLSKIDKRRLFMSMRRTGFALSETGHEIRKQLHIQRFNLEGCRTHDVVLEGTKFPFFDRPSAFSLSTGDQIRIEEKDLER